MNDFHQTRAARPAFRLAGLLPALLVALSPLGVALGAQVAPAADGPVAAVFPPWWAGHDALAAAADTARQADEQTRQTRQVMQNRSGEAARIGEVVNTQIIGSMSGAAEAIAAAAQVAADSRASVGQVADDALQVEASAAGPNHATLSLIGQLRAA